MFDPSKYNMTMVHRIAGCMDAGIRHEIIVLISDFQGKGWKRKHYNNNSNNINKTCARFSFLESSERRYL